MRKSGKGSISSSTNFPTTEANPMEPSEDKLFRKFILRKNMEDSAFEDSRENLPSRGSNRRLLSTSKNLSTIKKKSSWLKAYNQSPRRQDTGSISFLSGTDVVSRPSQFQRPISRTLEKSIIYGDKMMKGQVKSNHPLTMFVSLFDLERRI
jgi:hypothetical protein